MSIKNVMELCNDAIRSSDDYRISLKAVDDVIEKNIDLINKNKEFYNEFGVSLADNLIKGYIYRFVNQENDLLDGELVKFLWLEEAIIEKKLITGENIFKILKTLFRRNNCYTNYLIVEAIKLYFKEDKKELDTYFIDFVNFLINHNAFDFIKEYVSKFDIKDLESIKNITEIVNQLRYIEVPRQNKFIEKVLNSNAIYNIEPIEILKDCEYVSFFYPDEEAKTVLNQLVIKIIDRYQEYFSKIKHKKQEITPQTNHFFEKMLFYMLARNEWNEENKSNESKGLIRKKIDKLGGENSFDEPILKIVKMKELDKGYYSFYNGVKSDLLYRILDSGNPKFIEAVDEPIEHYILTNHGYNTQNVCSLLIKARMVDKAVKIFNHPNFCFFEEEELRNLKTPGSFEIDFQKQYNYKDTLTDIIDNAIDKDAEIVIDNILLCIKYSAYPKIQYISCESIYNIIEFYKRKYDEVGFKEKVFKLYNILREKYQFNKIDFICFEHSSDEENYERVVKIKVALLKQINELFSEFVSSKEKTLKKI